VRPFLLGAHRDEEEPREPSTRTPSPLAVHAAAVAAAAAVSAAKVAAAGAAAEAAAARGADLEDSVSGQYAGHFAGGAQQAYEYSYQQQLQQHSAPVQQHQQHSAQVEQQQHSAQQQQQQHSPGPSDSLDGRRGPRTPSPGAHWGAVRAATRAVHWAEQDVGAAQSQSTPPRYNLDSGQPPEGGTNKRLDYSAEDGGEVDGGDGHDRDGFNQQADAGGASDNRGGAPDNGAAAQDGFDEALPAALPQALRVEAAMKLLNIKAEQATGKAYGSTAHLGEGSGHRVRRLPPSHHEQRVEALVRAEALETGVEQRVIQRGGAWQILLATS